MGTKIVNGKVVQTSESSVFNRKSNATPKKKRSCGPMMSCHCFRMPLWLGIFIWLACLVTWTVLVALNYIPTIAVVIVYVLSLSLMIFFMVRMCYMASRANENTAPAESDDDYIARSAIDNRPKEHVDEKLSNKEAFSGKARTVQ